MGRALAGGRKRPRRRLIATTGAGLLVAALAASGCSAGSSSSPAAATGGSASAGGNQLIIELNGPLSTEGFSQAKLGSAAAAKALGISYEYSAPPSLNNFVTDYTALIKEAIARHPAAMVIGNFIPSAFDPLIKQVSAAGIPVVVINSGLPSYQSDGAIGYVGVSSDQDGQAAAAATLKAGSKHLLCVDQTTNPLVEAVCLAAKPAMVAAGGTYDQLNVPLTDIGNPAQLTQDIQGYLSSHPQIDSVFTAGGGFGTDAVEAVAKLGKTGKIVVGGNEVIPSTLQDIRNGSVNYEVGLQQYLMGYDAIQMASQYLSYNILPTTPVITSGFVVDKGNIDRETAVAGKYPGIPG
jgi:simple sugar transport system substrate-binding protein